MRLRKEMWDFRSAYSCYLKEVNDAQFPARSPDFYLKRFAYRADALECTITRLIASWKIGVTVSRRVKPS
jgi:hypothetical protein